MVVDFGARWRWGPAPRLGRFTPGICLDAYGRGGWVGYGSSGQAWKRENLLPQRGSNPARNELVYYLCCLNPSIMENW